MVVLFDKENGQIQSKMDSGCLRSVCEVLHKWINNDVDATRSRPDAEIIN